MKKLFVFKPAFLFATVIITIFSVSCKSSETYDLKMRLAKGDVFEQNMAMKMDMKMMSMDMKMQMETGAAFEVLRNDDAGKELKITYTKMHTTMNMGGMPNPVPNSDSVMNAPTKRLVGKSVTMILSKDNEIKEVKGIEAIMVDESADSMTQDIMRKMFSKDQMSNLFGMMFSMYPKTPVKIGDSWKGETIVNVAGMDMKVAMKYTLKAVKDGLADIAVDGIIDGKGKMNTGGMNMDMNMSGNQNGIMTITTADGYLKSSTYTMDIKAEMEMMGQKVPMTMKAEYDLKGK